jgi:hypothetical protein
VLAVVEPDADDFRRDARYEQRRDENLGCGLSEDAQVGSAKDLAVESFDDVIVQALKASA